MNKNIGFADSQSEKKNISNDLEDILGAENTIESEDGIEVLPSQEENDEEVGANVPVEEINEKEAEAGEEVEEEDELASLDKAALPVIDLKITQKQELAAAYMPFLKEGGLFVRAKHLPNMGDKIRLNIKFFDEPQTFSIIGKVIWLTPLHAQGQRAPGFGLQFLGDETKEICSKIETHLAGMMDSISNTDTM